MALQSTYSTERAAFYQGMIAGTGPSNVVSREIEGASVGFGECVVQGTADEGAVIASGAADVVIGITTRSPASNTTDAYAVGDTAGVLVRGTIVVQLLDTVVAGAPVYVGVNSASTKFTDTTTSNLLVPGATFLDSGVADDLVRIQLNN